MKRSERIAQRLSEVLLDGTWIANTNFKAEIVSLSYTEATTKVGDLHTISVLTYHINYYLEGLLKVFKGGNLKIKDAHSFNMPLLRSQKEWEKLKEHFISNTEEFIHWVHTVKEDLLDAVFVAPRYGTYERNIEGVIEHCYYHLGQVVLIKKLIAFQSKNTSF